MRATTPATTPRSENSRADRVIHRHDVARDPDRQVHPTLLQSANDFFRRNISDELVLRERTSAQSADGRIEAPAPGIDTPPAPCAAAAARCCAYERRPRISGSRATPPPRPDESVPAPPLRPCPPGKSKCMPMLKILFAPLPRPSLRSTDRHTDYRTPLKCMRPSPGPHPSAISLIRLQHRLIFLRRLVLISAQERLGNGAGIAERRHFSGRDGARGASSR